MKQVSSTNIMANHTKFSCHSDLAPEVCALLGQTILWMEYTAIFQKCQCGNRTNTGVAHRKC